MLYQSVHQLGLLVDGFRNWNWRHYSFYLGVPVALALYSALNNWELLRIIGFSGTAFFYAAHALVPFWTSVLATHFIMESLRRFQPHQLTILALGALSASLLMLPYTQWVTEVFFLNWGLPQPHSFTVSLDFSDLITGLLPYLLRAVLIWIAVNLFFERVLGLPRYRYDASDVRPFAFASLRTGPTESSSAQQGRARIPATGQSERYPFLERLNNQVSIDDVLAISAEQHYIRIHTPDRDHVVLHRFSDAIAELSDTPGMQVHRSHWVRNDAIQNIRSNSKKMQIALANGTEIPVSGPYKQLVKQLAMDRIIPSLPLTHPKKRP